MAELEVPAELRCEICKQMRPRDEFANPHAQICEGCYRAAGIDVWAAGDQP